MSSFDSTFGNFENDEKGASAVVLKRGSEPCLEETFIYKKLFIVLEDLREGFRKCTWQVLKNLFISDDYWQLFFPRKKKYKQKTGVCSF